MTATRNRYTAFCTGLLLLVLLSGCSTKYTTSQGQEIVLQEHEALFLKNCENNKWWDKHSPAANCGFFGKDILRSDPIGGLNYLKQGCDKGDDLSCLEFSGNAFKLATNDNRYKLIHSYKLPEQEITKARSYALDLCLNRKIFLNGADNTKWLCFFSGRLNSEVEPVDISNAIKSYKENCDKRGDCAELKKIEKLAE